MHHLAPDHIRNQRTKKIGDFNVDAFDDTSFSDATTNTLNY